MEKPHVVVYVSDNCSHSEKVLSLLEYVNVPYEKKNISEEKKVVRELQQHQIYGTPATFINNQVILGYQKYKIKQALGMLTGVDREKINDDHFYKRF
ncbi:glutaredoxin family protein [Aquibacillus sp. 3ASR75-11]|uniref:Glutaredoxin family protein n=1 Tax=Terrihalobacillus insolitus TaxID=2950438 RepID=A0A9X3WVX4_9BACI|nr:glutaredoxin family protein [Terrihalobacillus insolitus]MDC3413132.1 glutaredoxin family protein [Terrihalobacillus insolitus]MDC3425196.1 glutaredoxin family protein [Terrihalobacillus insolitus]